MTTAVLIWLACSASFLVGWVAHAWIAKRRFVTEPVSAERAATFIDLRDERPEPSTAGDLRPEDAHLRLRLRR